MIKTLKLSPQHRHIQITRAAVNTETRTVELSFSSEEPYERYWGIEILDHSPKSMRLKRLKAGGAVLVDHDPCQQVGVIEEISIGSDRKGRAVVRFGKSPRAEQEFQDIVDGIRQNVSVGYQIHKAKEESPAVYDKDGGEVKKATYRVTDWEPYEVSMVSIPADIKVGVGREATAEETSVTVETEPPQKTNKETIMKKCHHCGADIPEGATCSCVIKAQAVETERKRSAAIEDIGVLHKMPELAKQFIRDGKSVDDFNVAVLAELRKAPPVQTPESGVDYGAGARHILNYAPQALKGWQRHGSKAEELAYNAGMWVKAAIFGDEKARKYCNDKGLSLRVMTEGTGSAGGYLVPDEMSSAIIDLRAVYGVARRICTVMQMGSATMSVPKRSSGTTAYFTGETSETTKSDAAWGSIDLVAKELSALTLISMSLAEDAIIDLAAWLAQEQAYSFAVKEDECLIKGDGTSTYGGMLGIITRLESSGYTAGRYTAASGNDTFAEYTAADLAGLMGLCPSYARNGAIWLSSPAGDATVFGRLMAAGGGNTIQSLAGSILNTYLGYARELAEPMVASGDLSSKISILFGNFRQGVLIGEKRGITVQVLRERYAEYRQIGIMATERIDIVPHGCGDTSTAGPIVGLYGN